MKKIEKVKIVLDEDEQKIYSDFVDLINRIDHCVGKGDYLTRSFCNFLDDFDEIVEDW